MNNPITNSFWGRLSSIITVGALLAAIPLVADDEHKASKEKEHGSHSATSFIKEAAEGNLAEVHMGQLAAQKSQNTQVKEFANRLIQDHQQANEKLKTVAQNQGVSWPTQPNKKQQRDMERFQKLSGSEFDQQFARHMIRDHARDIAKYEHAASHLQDNSVKEYTQNTLPVLREHLKQAEQVGKSLGLSQENISSLEKPLHGSMGAPGSESGTEKGPRWHKRSDDKR